jgi:CheY-like chemotaxis protein
MRKEVGGASSQANRPLDLARVLLVHGELAPRLTLQTLLQAGGYAVDVAATPAEALTKLDEGRYELVISDAEFGSRPAGRKVLAYARVKEYRPATALLTSYEPAEQPWMSETPEVSIHTEDVPMFLEEVAELIGARASRRYRPTRQSAFSL